MILMVVQHPFRAILAKKKKITKDLYGFVDILAGNDKWC